MLIVCPTCATVLSDPARRARRGRAVGALRALQEDLVRDRRQRGRGGRAAWPVPADRTRPGRASDDFARRRERRPGRRASCRPRMPPTGERIHGRRRAAAGSAGPRPTRGSRRRRPKFDPGVPDRTPRPLAARRARQTDVGTRKSQPLASCGACSSLPMLIVVLLAIRPRASLNWRAHRWCGTSRRPPRSMRRSDCRSICAACSSRT